MAINFPTSLDSLTNPQGTDSVQAVSHAAQHADANDAIEALEAKVGADNSTVTTSLDYRVNALENASLDEEGIQQIAADLLTNGTHTNIVVTYDDANDKINLEATYGDEEAIDAIATALTTGTGITKTYTQNPPNYIGDYNNGYSYALNDVVSIPTGSPYGAPGEFYIRSGNPGNPGYPPGTLSSWTPYVFSPTITIAVDTNAIATQSYVTTAISNLIDSSPALLNTLNEIAAAIGNDANFATTITNALALKAPLASPALTGTPTAPTATTGTNTTQIATTAFVKTAADGAVTAANEYTDEAVASLGDSLPNTYVPISDVGNAGGVASLGLDGKVPSVELDIDSTIQSVASTMITGGTHTNLSVTYDSVTKKLNFTAEAGGGANVSISSNPPSSPNAGDLWLDSDTATLYAYDGGFWLEVSGSGGGGTSGGGSFILSVTAPTSPTEGDTWFDTENGKLYVYYDSYWIEAIATGATGPTGPMFLDYQGLWSSGVGYLENEGVTYNGSLWRLNATSSPAGTVPSTPNWQQVIQKGDKGDTGELVVGTVTTVTHGNSATVTNAGTSTDAILNFVIPAGPAATIAVGDVDTVLYGNPLTVTNSGTTSSAVFDFEIPAGRAATISVGSVDDVLYGQPPTVTNSGNTSDATFDFEIPAGRAATLAVGTVTTVLDGEPATVVNSGDTSDAVFDFEIPAGPRSTITIGTVDDVDFGTAPTVTNSGTTSDAIFDFELTTGRASTLAVGTVTTGSYASSATVTNAGTSSDAVFNFSIPQGIPGDFQPGETPPANPLAGQVWYNTASGRAYVYHDSFWVEFSPGFVGQPGATGPAGPAGANGADGESASDLNPWTTYTPTWTSDSGTPSIGNGSITGRYKQIGKTVFFNLKLTYGTTTTGGSGAWMFELPVTAYDSNYHFPVSILNNGLAWYGAIANGNYKNSTSHFSIIHQNDTQTTVWGGVTSGTPFTFGDSDTLSLSGSYEAV